MEFDDDKAEREVYMDDIEISHEDQQNKKSKSNRSGAFSNVEVHKDRGAVDFDNSQDRDKRNQLNALEVSQPGDDNDLQVVDKFKVPPHLKKTFICSMVLFVMGLTLFILGFIQDVAAADPGKGITFWVLGGIVMIPGGFYSYKFYRAKKARSLDERDEILEDIPEL